MANPNDQRTPEERRIDEKRRELENERELNGGSGWWAWWWVWLLIILFIVWFGGWGWGGYGGWWGWGARQVVSAPSVTNARPSTAYGKGVVANNGLATNAAPVANVAAIVSSNNKQQFVGRQVDLKDVPVQDVDPHGTLWVGQNQDNRVLVVEQGAGNGRPVPSKIQKGENVNVRGTIEHVQNSSELTRQWDLTSAQAQKAEKDGVYILAQRINPTQAGAGPHQ